jgi:hypothetical protein
MCLRSRLLFRIGIVFYSFSFLILYTSRRCTLVGLYALCSQIQTSSSHHKIVFSSSHSYPTCGFAARITHIISAAVVVTVFLFGCTKRVKGGCFRNWDYWGDLVIRKKGDVLLTSHQTEFLGGCLAFWTQSGTPSKPLDWMANRNGRRVRTDKWGGGAQERYTPRPHVCGAEKSLEGALLRVSGRCADMSLNPTHVTSYLSPSVDG